MFTNATDLTSSELQSAIVRHPLRVEPKITVREAIVYMNGVRTTCDTTKVKQEQLEQIHLEARSSCVLVMEGDRLRGILTERDIVRLSAQHCSLENLIMGDVMVHPVFTLKESVFNNLFMALNLLQKYHIRHVPILDDREQVVGLVTHESLRYASRYADLLRLRLVSEVMTHGVICAMPEHSLLAIAQLMAKHRVSSIVIVEEAIVEKGILEEAIVEEVIPEEKKQEQVEQMPVGMITEHDIVQCQSLGLDLSTSLSKAVMSTPVFTVKASDSLWLVQQIMEKHSIHRLPVMEKGKLLGIVTQTTLLQTLNPVELYKIAEVLEHKVIQLEAKVEERTQELGHINSLQQAILNSTDYSIISTDTQGMIQTFNTGAERMLGYSAVEVIGKSIPELIHDRQELIDRAASLSVELGRDIAPGFEVFVAKACQDMVSEAEWTYIRKDGSCFPVLLSVTALKNTDTNKQSSSLGQISGFLGIAKDISEHKSTLWERKQAEVVLQKSEAHQRALISAIPDLICRVNRAGIYLEFVASPNFLVVGNLSEMVGTHVFDSLPLDVAQKRMEAIQLASQTNSIQIYTQDLSSDRTTQIEEVRVVPYSDDEVLLLVRDITEQQVALRERHQAELDLKQSEARFQTLVKNMPGMIYRYLPTDNGVGYFTYVSSGAKELSELEPSQIIQDANSFWSLIHPDDVPSVQSSVAIAIQNSANWHWEGRLITPSGQMKWIQGNSRPQSTPEGLVWDGLMMDISEQQAALRERKQAEAELQQATQQLEARLEELNQHNREMVLLSEMNNFLQTCLSIEEAYQVLSSLINPLFPGCSGGVFIIDASRNHVKNVSIWGVPLSSELEFYLNDCWALRRGRKHLVNPENPGLYCNHILPSEAIEQSIFPKTDDKANPNTLCIPLIAQGETLGLLYLSTETSALLPEAKQQLAQMVAEQVALAIANLHLWETLQQKSIRDSLTGLFNRRYLEEALTKEIALAQRKQYPIGVIMIDIDHFKQFNDNFGHEAGDYVLQSVGKLIGESIRKSDIACRYGGEELTLILPESSLDQTSSKAEELRRAIAQLVAVHDNQPVGKITVSLGVAAFPQHGIMGSTLIQAADIALYSAKAAGRNQVAIAATTDAIAT